MSPYHDITKFQSGLCWFLPEPPFLFEVFEIPGTKGSLILKIFRYLELAVL